MVGYSAVDKTSFDAENLFTHEVHIRSGLSKLKLTKNQMRLFYLDSFNWIKIGLATVFHIKKILPIRENER